MIAHPPCTKLSYAGLRWFKVQPGRMDEARTAFEFFMKMVNAPIPQIAIENPKGFPSKWYRMPDQKIHPYHFGEPYTKETHLWLKNLPPLMFTQIHADPFVNWARNKSGSHSAKARSKTFPKIAAAMARQWGQLPLLELA